MQDVTMISGFDDFLMYMAQPPEELIFVLAMRAWRRLSFGHGLFWMREPIILDDITMPRKFRGRSSLRPKPIQRIGVDEHAALVSKFSKT
jgi:hypothetical protein